MTFSLSKEEKIDLKTFSATYTSNLKKRWNSSYQSRVNFVKKFADYLDSEIKWPEFVASRIKQLSCTGMRYEDASISDISTPTPSTSKEFAVSDSVSVSTSTFTFTRKEFADLRPLQKKRRTENFLSEYDFDTLIYALTKKVEKENQMDFAELLKHLKKHPEDATMLRACLKSKKRTCPPDKALGLSTSLNLSKWQYKTLKKTTKDMGCDFFPSYDYLNKQKEECYVQKEDMQITESEVKLKLQSVLDITIQRLFKTLETDASSLTLTSKWGFDGASGHSKYKQKMEGDDSSIFMCSFVPIQLVRDDTGEVVWDNPKASSTFYCRPIYFKFAKENDLNMKEEMALIETEIAALQPTVVEHANVQHKLHMTMVDGKITSHLSDTSTATCDICKAKPKEMNDIDMVSQRSDSVNMFKFGLSTLHAKIRCMECILHIAYRLDFKKWQAKGEDIKQQLANRKKIIQERFREKMGLLVDVVKQGAGTTNDGNTARRFFANPQVTSDITGVDTDVINRFRVILQVISCGEFVDVEKFRQYCTATAHRYIELYGWYYMPSSVHKLLLHGADIIEHNNFLPIGKLSEEASEARNKDFKKFRTFHSRKMSRITTNEDVIHNLLISSDPYLSSFRPRMRQCHSQPLSNEAKLLLVLTSGVDKENVEFVDVENLSI